MSKMCKWITVLTFTIILCGIVVLPHNIIAAERVDGDYIYYVFENEASICEYIGDDSKIQIPSKLGGFTVTSIATYAFSSNDAVKCITMADTIETIDNYAFMDCEKLETIELSKNLTHIGVGAFSCTALKEIKFPKKVEAILDHAFFRCKNLKHVYFEGNLPLFSNSFDASDAYAFMDCTFVAYYPKKILHGAMS